MTLLYLRSVMNSRKPKKLYHYKKNSQNVFVFGQGCKCRFYANVKKFPFAHMVDMPSVWDLEDLIRFGKKKTTCPYFLARELMTSADVVFCPYNYIIDPLIRQNVRSLFTTLMLWRGNLVKCNPWIQFLRTTFWSSLRVSMEAK